MLMVQAGLTTEKTIDRNVMKTKMTIFFIVDSHMYAKLQHLLKITSGPWLATERYRFH